jgi:D-ribose pyranase
MGFPVPHGAYVVDITLIKGIPSFMDVLKAVLNEAIFDEYWVVDSIDQFNSKCSMELNQLMPKHTRKEVDFEILCEASKTAKLVIRTAEPLPASNIVLISSSGVPSLCKEFDIHILES